jgi:hypothetical protein
MGGVSSTARWLGAGFDGLRCLGVSEIYSIGSAFAVTGTFCTTPRVAGCGLVAPSGILLTSERGTYYGVDQNIILPPLT